MRTRHMDLGVETLSNANRSVHEWYDGSVFVRNNRTSTVSVSGHGSMTDQKNPGYFRAKREGSLLPVSPMQKSKSFCRMVAGSHDIRVKNKQPYNYNIRHAGYGVLITGDWARLRNTANRPSLPSYSPSIFVQEALARAQTDAWDTLTFLAEFNKTVQLLTGLRGLMESSFRRLAADAGSIAKRGERLFDVMSRLWLTGRYSMRPIYYDMLAINESIRRVTEGVESPLSRGWSTSDPFVNSNVWSSRYEAISLLRNGLDDWTTYATVGTAANSTARWTRSVVCRATVGVQVTTRAVTMSDPLVTAWELVPFSFVFDWFITTGTMIAAFSPFATGLLRYATLTVTEIEERTFTSVPATSPAPPLNWEASTIHASSPGLITLTDESVVRTLPTPTPTLAVDVNLDAAKVLDLVALIFSMRRGFMRTIR